MSQKNIIVVHGRGTKPQPGVLRRMIKRALVAGLERVDAKAAHAVASSQVKLTLAYYGDVTTDLMADSSPQLTDSLIRRHGKWYEHPERDLPGLERLMARPTDRHTEEDHKELLKSHKNRRFLDDVVRVVSPLASITGLGVYAVGKLFPDLGAYLGSRRWGSEIRHRLQCKLRPALARGDDVALVAHSMGCIVAYDVLWKLSRMREHSAVHQRRVSLWLTAGSPLGDKSIKDCLYDSNEGEDGLYPANVVEWVNVAAHDDFVAHDGTAVDDFRDMRRRGLVESIRDLAPIYTFWVGSKGANPHKFYGYINHPETARVVAQWIRGNLR
jgi:hypothetical protein